MITDCPCKKRNCPRHGDCEACREHHANSKRQRPVKCERQSNTPVIKTIGITAAIFVAGILLLIGSFTYVTRYKITDIDSSTSPNGDYTVLYQNVGEPDWPFGYSHARLVLKHKDKTVSKYKFDVANDGGVLQPDSWSILWKDNCAEVTISGEEQSDVLYILSFDGRIDSVQLDTKCGEWK